MKNRKYRMVGLCGAMILGMAGCAGTSTASTEETTKEITETVMTQEPEMTEAPTTEAPTTVEETTETETEPFVYNTNRHWENDADISWIDPQKPMVALSFDDGPVNPVSPDSTAMRIQNVLAENGMHATFFYWGNSLNQWTKKELEMAYEKGFELGNHTLKHANLTQLTEEEIIDQVSAIDEVLYSITGKTQFLLRPPYLAVNQLAKDTIHVPLISCLLDTQDWNKKSTEEIIERVVKAAENGTLDGAIVLMHETMANTAEAMEYLVPWLKEHDYQVVTISELFKVRGKEMEAGQVYTCCK